MRLKLTDDDLLDLLHTWNKSTAGMWIAEAPDKNSLGHGITSHYSACHDPTAVLLGKGMKVYMSGEDLAFVTEAHEAMPALIYELLAWRQIGRRPS